MEWSKVRVLLVHSDIHVRRWAHDVLHKQKVGSVQSTRSATNGLALLKRFRADVAVVQLAQADMDGAEFARQVRDGVRSPNPDLPVVLVVDTPHPELLRAACEAGIEGVIARPTTPETFVTKIENAIRDPQRFVSSETYFGPCRRKETPPDYPGPYRREQDPEEKKAAYEKRIAEKKTPDVPVKAATAQRKKARAWEEDDLPPVAAKIRDGELDLSATGRRQAPQEPRGVETPAKAEKDDRGWKEALVEEEEPAAPADRGPDIEAIVKDHELWLRTTGAEGTKAWMERMDLAGRSIAEANLTSAALREADLSDVDCRKSILASADLRRAELSAANLNGTDLSVANLRGANLKLARFGETSLRGADLAGASFAGTSVEDSDFSGANLLDTDFTGADLSRAKGLIQRQIDKSRLDGKTQLPPGIRRPGA